MSKTSSTLFLVIVFGAVFLVNQLLTRYDEQMPLPIYGQENHIIPDFEFENQEEKIINSKELQGKIWIVNYFFTACPSICPTMTKNLQNIHDLVRNDHEIAFLSFTVDPKRDTPKKLKEYANRYNANHNQWHFLTGDKTMLYRLARKGFLLSASDGATSDDSGFIHSENVMLIDQEQNIRGIYVGTDEKSMQQCLDDLKKLKSK